MKDPICSKPTCKESEPHKHCRGCGYAVHVSETYCGECVCEDDSE